MKYRVSLEHIDISYPADYIDYIFSRYIENVDYRLDILINMDTNHYRKYPLNLRRLICAYSIYFKNEEDALDFKLRYGE